MLFECCTCHPKLASCAPSALPALQKQHRVHRMLQLPRKRTRDSATRVDQIQPPDSPSTAPASKRMRGRKETFDRRKRRPGFLRSAPATQKQNAITECFTCRPKKLPLPLQTGDQWQRPGFIKAAAATQKEHRVQPVLHLPRKSMRCPAETLDQTQRPGVLSPAPATQKHPVHRLLHLPGKKVRTFLQTMDQNQPPGLLNLAPTMEEHYPVQQVLHLPHERVRRPAERVDKQ